MASEVGEERQETPDLKLKSMLTGSTEQLKY